MTQITAQFVRERYHYDPETGVMTRLLPGPRGIKAGSEIGWTDDAGYRRAVIGGELPRVHRLAWLYMTGSWPAAGVDHINGNRLDNRWANLREADQLVNMQNLRGPIATNKTGFLGVCKKRGRFAAYIKADRRNKYLGTYDTPELAHEAYVKAKREFHIGGTL